jgi:predicted Zn-dependent protease
VLSDPSVNAFALPGGEVFVLTGLLEKAGSVEQLAGVLAHELGHVAHRHGMRVLAHRLGLGAALGLVFGGFDQIVDALAVAATDLERLAFSREQERDADAFGIELLLRAGIDPRGLPEFFGQLEGYRLPDWLATHPAPSDRRQRILDLVAGRRPASPVSLPPLEALRAPCQKAP